MTSLENTVLTMGFLASSLTDVSAHFYLRKILGKDILSFTVPRSLFEEMEGNGPESFLTRFAWKSMMGK